MRAGIWLRHGIRALLVALLLVLASGTLQDVKAQTPAERAARESEAERKLDAVRVQIGELVAARNALDAERGDAARALREADQEIDRQSRTLEQIDTEIEAQEAELARLEGERLALETGLGEQREALATLLRSAYALGRHEQLKVLLSQDRIETLARVLAYHRYFQRDRLHRIEGLLAELKELAQIVQQVRLQREALEASRALQQEQIAELESQRGQRRVLVAELDARFRDTDSRLKALGRDEAALTKLLEQLRDIFADIPAKLEAAQPFTQRRGRLAAAVPGKILVGFGAKLPDGRTSHGWLLAADAGVPVRAVAHGRVAFSDWLKGYGLIVILEHGEGYMSLYAQNDSLRREVGEWVDAGDVLASVGSSGGQSGPALYFELRRGGQPIDPRGWFAPR